MKITLLNNQRLLFQFPFNPVYSRIINQLPHATWHPDLAGWGVPYSPLAAWLCLKLFPDQHYYADNTYTQLHPAHRPAPPTLPAGLYDFQRTGAHFLATKAGAIANDCPGAGKTRQALSAAQTPTLVVCPAAVVFHWQSELQQLLSPEYTCTIVRGRRGPLPNADVLICTPAIIPARCRQLLTHSWQSVIVDEIHEYRNPAAKRTKALLAITTRVPHVIGVTGTIIINRIADLFSQLSAIKQLSPKDQDFFERRYCGKTKPTKHWNRLPDGFTHEVELREFLTTCVLHRTRADLQRSLPPLNRSAVVVPLSNQTEYQESQAQVSEWLRIAGTAAPPETQMIKINRLRRLGAIGKVPAVIARTRTLLEAGEPVVIACSFLTPLRQLEAALPATLRLDGGVSKSQRQERIALFQRSSTPLVALCSMKAMGLGVTLTRARYVLLLDLPWAPADIEQMEARIHRETQTRECFSEYVLGDQTTDRFMLSLLRKKARWANRLFEGGDAPFIDPLQALSIQLSSTAPAPPVNAADFATGSITMSSSAGSVGPASPPVRKPRRVKLLRMPSVSIA